MIIYRKKPDKISSIELKSGNLKYWIERKEHYDTVEKYNYYGECYKIIRGNSISNCRYFESGAWVVLDGFSPNFSNLDSIRFQIIYPENLYKLLTINNLNLDIDIKQYIKFLLFPKRIGYVY